jgi:large subunit ribosomal protein L32e
MAEETKKELKEEAKEAKKEEKKKAKVEEEESVEVTKIKPKLSEKTKKLLELRAAKKAKEPEFRRQEWFRYGRIGEEWRRPRGSHSKQRRHFNRRPNVVSIGYGGPAEVRGYHPSGFKEVLIHNLNELTNVNPETEAIRIAGGVGLRLRRRIEKRADKRGIRILNRVATREE